MTQESPQPPAPPADDVVAVLRRLQAVVRVLESRLLAGERATHGTLTPAAEVAQRDGQIRALRQQLDRLEAQLLASERARGALEERVSYQLQLLEGPPVTARGRRPGADAVR